MTSQITPAGFRPGEPREVDGGLGLAGALEHAAGAWPAAGRRGRGWTRSRGAASPGRSRPGSCARGRRREMPVVTPSRASIETVNGGLDAATRSWPPSGRGRARRSAPGSARGRSARGPRVAMKLMASGVTNWAAIDEVALVLAVLVVDDDDHPPGADVLERLLDRGERCSRLIVRAPTSFSTYLASTSTSRLTGLPGAAAPSVVRSSVSGISETSKRSSSTRDHGQRDAVDRDRALLDDVAQQRRGARRSSRPARSRPRAIAAHGADAVDVALHDVAAEAVARRAAAARG